MSVPNMHILESIEYPVFIPTNADELAFLLDSYSHDWVTTLDFLCSVAGQQGIFINRQEVTHKLVVRKLIRMYGNEDENVK